MAKKRSYNIDYIVSTPEVQQNSVPVPSNQTQHSMQNQNFEDVTPEEGGVKHARTPLNTVSQETHSPQLPIPSPNYPMQAEAQLPNTVVVPTINNNYIITPHATSQCDLKENTNSSTECCQPHSNRLNNNSKSDLKETDHLTNLEVVETKSVKVNLPEKKSTQEPENSFTVLNIPNLSFQTPSKKPKLSKIDLATLKRKMRRKKRLKTEKSATKTSGDVTDASGSSYCSSSEGESEIRDLWIRTGPPSKPDLKPEKVDFLKLFDLTTHAEKNCRCCFLLKMCCFEK